MLVVHIIVVTFPSITVRLLTSTSGEMPRTKCLY